MRQVIFGTVFSLLLASAPAIAQDGQPGRLRLEPYAGMVNDSYDISPDGDKTGIQMGLRFGYDVHARARVIANVGYAASSDVSNPNGLNDYFVYDNTWALTTVGAEYDVLPGRTSASLGIQLGAGWRRDDRSGQVGRPAAYTDWYGGGGFSPYDVVVPSLAVRHELSPRAALLLTAEDYIFDVLEGPSNHSPAIGIGLSLRR